jgi:ABC-type transport system substrate-binding protein
MNRAAWLLAVVMGATSTGAAGGAQKVLRYAFDVAETTLDPHKVSDLYSNYLISAIFDTPLEYDYLHRPPKLKPAVTEAMPEVSADGLTYTMKIRPGIFFADDPAFGGRPRELVAGDFVYSFKRLLDPQLASPLLGEVEGVIAGTDEALARARKANRLDYDAPIEGLQAPDRYTFRVKLTKPSGVFIYALADCRLSCAIAREAVERYAADIGSHPVGSGPYRVAFWKRTSKLVLERNPSYREEYFDGQPAPGDAEAEAILAQMKGRRLPQVDRFEVTIVEESQPRWLAFLNEDLDLIYRLPEDFATQAAPAGRLNANLARRGIGISRVPGLDLTFAYFNMEDPLVGGYTPEKVALRRAIALGYNTRDEINIVRKGQAIPARTPYAPGVAGYDPDFRTHATDYDVAKARALLDMFGYIDRDGDGYREQPDGSPLVLRDNSSPTARDTQLDELWKRSMDDIGLKITFRKAMWPDLLKESDAGKLMMWRLGGAAASPDADTWLTTFYGPNAGFKGNRSRFRLEAYDRLYEKAREMNDSPGRTRLYQEMTRLVLAYMPYKLNTHRILTDLWHPWVLGFRRPLVDGNSFWKYVDIDAARHPLNRGRSP